MRPNEDVDVAEGDDAIEDHFQRELVCIDALHSGMYSLFESMAKTIRHTEINR